ncbi:hypothetical protein C3941_18015 [Kaistia algarum]|uniref:hypothetical protein n=1 Tax=Kaistia algarum TaxID=2083279 RepID=UPI000CE8C8B4|nr:hypothetical protein [Kaistia algarum]MCX5515491.1 hypothetical protein [Kaistia algarum]PPE78453.1 hypothetical protein C3941_18015 [Kaistia algarum]
MYALTLLFFCILWATTIHIERLSLPDFRVMQSPYSWFLISWVPGAVLLALPIYRFAETFTLADAMYVGALHASFVGGNLLAVLARKQAVSPDRKMRSAIFSEPVIAVFLLIGLVGQVLIAVDAQRSGTLSFSDRFSLTSISDIKKQYTDLTQSSSFGSFAAVMRYMVAFGQVAIIAYSCAAANRVDWARRRPLFLLVVLLIFVSIVNSWISTGGRLGIIVTALFCALPWTLQSAWRDSFRRGGIQVWQLIRRYLLPGIIAAVAVVFLSTAFLQNRIGENAPLDQMYLAHRAQLDRDLLIVVQDMPSLQTGLLQASYLTSGLPTLSYYLHLNDYLPGPDYGLVNFQIFYLTFGRLFPGYDNQAGATAYNDLLSPLSDRGYFANVWGTMAREVLIDFGRHGTLVFFLVFGFLSSRLRIAYYFSPTLEVGVLYTLFRMQMIFSGFHSLISHRLFGYAFVVALAIWLVARMARSPRQMGVTLLPSRPAR